MKKSKRVLIVALIALAGTTLFLAMTVFGISTPCPSKVLFGFDCAGCGATRMFTAILHGRFYQAFRFNPLIFVLLPFSAVAVLYSAVAFVNAKQNVLLSKKLIWVYVVLFVIATAFTVMRNIPAFSFLAPTVI